MIRILLLLIVIVLVVVTVRFPQFRKTMGLTLIILFLTIGIIIWQDSMERSSEYQRISVAQTELSHMSVRPGLNSRSFVVSGRLQNLASAHSILSATLRVTLEDCQDSECEIIGQEQSDLSIEIPPEQARDFTVTIPFSSMPSPQGKPVWHYEILKIRAR